MPRRAAPLLALALLAAAGCAAAPDGPTALVVEPADYGEAFDAAVEAARGAGLVPVFLDRRRGVIVTETRLAGTILEPWRTDHAGPEQAWATSLSTQRRRARFEFSPAGAAPPDPAAPPDLLGTAAPPADRTTAREPLRLAVRVDLERRHEPGREYGTWSLRTTTRTVIPPREGRPALPAEYWTPVERDPAYERRLLAAVEASLARAGDPAPEN